MNPGNFLAPKVLDFNPFGVLTPNKKKIKVKRQRLYQIKKKEYE